MLRKLILAATLAVGLTAGVASAGQHYSVGQGPARAEVERQGLQVGVDAYVFGQHYSLGQ